MTWAQPNMSNSTWLLNCVMPLVDHVRCVLVARPSDSTCAHGTQEDWGFIYAASEILSTHKTNNSFAIAEAMWVCRDW